MLDPAALRDRDRTQLGLLKVGTVHSLGRCEGSRSAWPHET